MKGYFAKLADRATLGNTLTSAVLTPKRPKTHDEDWGESQELSSARESGTQTQVSSNEAPRVVKTPNAQLQILPSLRPLVLQSHLPEPASTARIEQIPAVNAPDKSGSSVQAEVEPIDLSFVSPEISSPNVKEEVRGEHSENSVGANDLAATVARLDHIENEQARLLQRADRFMDEFFANNSSTNSTQEIETQPPGPLREIPPRERSLTPTAVKRVEAPTVTSQNKETASLVIGELTVEVVSPAPNIDKSPQVIVVHGKQTRTSATFTNRSFGLNQF